MDLETQQKHYRKLLNNLPLSLPRQLRQTRPRISLEVVALHWLLLFFVCDYEGIKIMLQYISLKLLIAATS